ncbi:MAG TPA: YafY family transcriptional regulator [Firmicutes bacterium]|jgi:predicted DNA-binding transcriptional regulator YafY|nr:YafY family transcriptional regulator [Bacillota bacterium]
MKIDRLLGIVMYLLNREIVSARVLAERFEVSPRTIQRDIEALNEAGIPVTSVQGSAGGYGIMDSFKLDRQIMNTDDYLFILTALKGLCTAYENRQLETTLEKLLAIAPLRQEQARSCSIRFDFDILREGANTGQYLALLDTVIHQKRAVVFEYTDAMNHSSQRCVEPITVLCKWYSWYLLGFCREKRDYRLFRLSRIRKLTATESVFSVEHREPEELLAEQVLRDKRTFLNIKMLCQPEDRVAVEEYFPSAQISQLSSGELLFECSLPENERGWFGILMSYGSRIKVLEPEELRKMLTQKAQEIVDNYY